MIVIRFPGNMTYSSRVIREKVYTYISIHNLTHTQKKIHINKLRIKCHKFDSNKKRRIYYAMHLSFTPIKCFISSRITEDTN